VEVPTITTTLHADGRVTHAGPPLAEGVHQVAQELVMEPLEPTEPAQVLPPFQGPKQSLYVKHTHALMEAFRKLLNDPQPYTDKVQADLGLEIRALLKAAMTEAMQEQYERHVDALNDGGK
jgi:hypothetical protein